MNAGSERDSSVVTSLCALSVAAAVLPIVASLIPFLARAAVSFSVPAALGAGVAIGIAQRRRSRLLLPALALLVSAIPAARYNWREMRVIWVESAELCHPRDLGAFSLFALLGELDVPKEREGYNDYRAHKEAIGNKICEQLGREFSDANCAEEIGRIECQ